MMFGGGTQFMRPICKDTVYAFTRSDAVVGYERSVRSAG
jgi:hypothetical protein